MEEGTKISSRQSEMMGGSASSILLVEDDRRTASLVEQYLARDGYAVMVALDGDEGLRLHREREPSCVVLDLTLPGLCGWDLCRAMLTISDAPVIILSARSDEADRILGLSLGADDYVVKPFSPRELVARVAAVLRRAQRQDRKVGAVLERQGIQLDRSRRKVNVRGRRADLTPSEFRILETMMNAPGRPFSRDSLLSALYPTGEAVVDRVIDVHIGNLRRKLEENAEDPRVILTVRGFGYEFADAEE